MERIDACLESGDCPDMLSFVCEGDVADNIREMEDRGYFKTLPRQHVTAFKNGIDAVYKNWENYPWKVGRSDDIHEEVAELSDVLLLAGWLPSFFLFPDELWEYGRFGFSSLTEFTGVVSAYMVNREKERFPFREGFKWTVHRGDKVVINEITGDHNCDFNLVQTDTTAYETWDPLGNKVAYRPECQEDRKGLLSHHSVEGTFLAILLKYVEQINVSSTMLQANTQPLIDYTRLLGQSIGFTAEHLTGTGLIPRFLFIDADVPLPELNKQFQPTGEGRIYFPSNSNHPYRAFVGPNKELVFLQEKSQVAASFQPTEIDNLLRGLMFQAAKGLGRTSARELIHALEYRFSEQYMKEST